MSDDIKLDALAIGAHPDDVELGCGGTVALLAKRGLKVGIVHLTSGERGTRGTPEERRSEAASAAEILGVVALEFLDFGDGALRTGYAEEEELIAVLRRYRPEVIFGPAPTDRHPDHGRANALVQAVSFYSGLAGRGPAGSGDPHRPAAVFSYMQNDSFEPRFIVDVTSVWEIKLASLAAYGSQIFRPGSEGRESDAARPEPVTKVSTPDFYRAMEGRARHFGNEISATFGEPFWCAKPLAVHDPMAILSRGVR